MDLPKKTPNTKNVVKRVLITPEQIAKLGLTAKIRSVVAPQLKQKSNSKQNMKQQNVSDNKLIKNQNKQNQDEITSKIKIRLKELIGTKLSSPTQIDNPKEESMDILLDKPSGSNIVLNNLLNNTNTTSHKQSNQDVKEVSQTNQSMNVSLNKPIGINVNLSHSQNLNDNTTTKSLNQNSNERVIEERSKVTIFQNEKVCLNWSTVENLLKTQESGKAISSKGAITLHATKKKISPKLNPVQIKEKPGISSSVIPVQKISTDKINLTDGRPVVKSNVTKSNEISTEKQNNTVTNQLEKCLLEDNLENPRSGKEVKYEGLLMDCLSKTQKNIALPDYDKSLNTCKESNSLKSTGTEINSTETETNLIQSKIMDVIKEEETILKKDVIKVAETSTVKKISAEICDNFNMTTKTQYESVGHENSDQCEDLIKSVSKDCITYGSNNQNITRNEHSSEVDKKQTSEEDGNIKSLECHDNISKGLNENDRIISNVTANDKAEKNNTVEEQPITKIDKSNDEKSKIMDYVDVTKQNAIVEDILDNNVVGVLTISGNEENIAEYETEKIISIVGTKKKATKWKSKMLEQSNFENKYVNKNLSEVNEEVSSSISSKKSKSSENTCTEVMHTKNDEIQLDISSINNNQVSTIDSCENKQIAETSIKLSNNKEVTQLPIKFDKKKKISDKQDLVNNGISDEFIGFPAKSKLIKTKKNLTNSRKVEIVDESNDTPFTSETKICKVITSTPNNENSKVNFNADELDFSINKTPSIKRGRKKLEDIQMETRNIFQSLDRPKRVTKLPKRFLDASIKNFKPEILTDNQNNYSKTQGSKRKLSKRYTADDLNESDLPDIQLPGVSLENNEKRQKREIKNFTLLNKDNSNSEIIGVDPDLQEKINNTEKTKEDREVSSTTLLEKSSKKLSADNTDSLNVNEIIVKEDKQVERGQQTQSKSNVKHIALQNNENANDAGEINKNEEVNSSLNQLECIIVPTLMKKPERIPSEAIDTNSKPVPMKRRGRPPKNSENHTKNRKSNSDIDKNKSIDISNTNLDICCKETAVDKNRVEILLIEDNSKQGDKLNDKLINDEHKISNKNCKENIEDESKTEHNSSIKISSPNNEVRNYSESEGNEIKDSSDDKGVTTNVNEMCDQNVPDTEKKKRGRPSKSKITVVTLPDLGKRKKEKVDYAYLEDNESVKKRRFNKRTSEYVSKEEGVVNEFEISKEVTCNSLNTSQNIVIRKRGRPPKGGRALSKDKIVASKIEMPSEDCSLNDSKIDATVAEPDLVISKEQFNIDGDVNEFIRKLRADQKVLNEELQSSLAGQLDCKTPLEIHQKILVTAFAVDMREEIEKCRIAKLEEKPESVKMSGKTITCAVCYKDLPNTSWTIHRKRYHNNLAWKVGETPIDFTNTTLVLYILNQFYKDRKPLYCSTCLESKKSPVGFLCHKMQCNKNDEMIEDMKISCNICTKLVMPYSLIEHMKCHKIKENKNQKIQEKVDTDERDVSGKRGAAVRASRIIQEALKDSVATTPNSIKKLYTKNFTPIKYDETKAIENITQNGFTKCNAEECSKESKSAEEARDHFQNCQFKTKKTYLCKNCDYICHTKEEICSHIETQHKSLLPPEIAEYNLMSDTEDEDTTSLQKRSQNKTVVTAKIYQFRFLSERSFIPDFSMYLNKLTFTKTLDFCRKNYESTLYTNLCFNQSNWSSLNAKQIMDYLPVVKKSLPVEQEQSKTVSFAQRHLKKNRRYKLFESKLEDNGSSIIFCGGPVSSMAWLPTPIDNESCDQILAISVLPDSNQKYHILHQHSGKNMVQFWNYGCLLNKNTSTFNPKLEFCLAHEYGVIWAMEWCPSGCFNKERMGLLAVGSSDSNIYLYSVGDPNYLSSTVYKVKPVLKLSLERKPDLNLGGVPYQATKISWSKAKGHKYISVGFSNGIIALYNLESTSELLQNINDDVNIIYPCLVFQAHQSMVTGISLYHLNNGKRWLATSSSDRHMKFWDLENIVEPISKNVRYPVSGIVWLNNWLCTIDAHDDVTNCIYQATSISHIKDFLHGNAILYSNSPVNAISGSNWSNTIVQGNVMGEVVGGYLKQLAPLNSETSLCKFYMSYTKLAPNSCATSAESKTFNDPGKMSTYKNTSKNHGLIFCDLNMKNYDIVHLSKATTGHRGKYQDYNLFSYPIQSISSIEINPNRYSFLYTAVGYQAGFVKLLHTKFLS